ncbi:Membrane-bound lytic murein transglycosylase D precursor [Moritella sp. JT01]|uniref:LysM peptidoglycan-binding domain-containing protein n=1 Tax=Moritella sp. JT01 TaxID=756698 RepID=UPI00079CBA81|nr:LysM peptidoglycan-binding domain-containing protein [Moritella sp. JT01]KXO07525.1 Membrane-bound lytic murein transglycosylase D precursor [Moritella sp. JT01]
MKFKLSIPVLILLTGCQMTPKDRSNDEQTTITPVVAQSQEASNKESGLDSITEKNIAKLIIAEDVTVEPIDNVWVRISEQMTIPIPDNARIAKHRNWYLKHPQHLKTVSQRAEPFLYLIVEELERRNLPLELALLPVVESAFDPFAYSHGSASGMWQFVPGTAKRFGLEQNWWYDGRRDVLASTSAALTYMEYLNRRFKGDWLHALASYNSGEGRVGRSIKRNQKAGLPTDFWSLSLPKETEAYVPKLLALADILKNPEKYNVTLPVIDNEPAIQQVDVNSQIDLALAADLAGMDVAQLQRLNPGFNQWATAPDGPHTLLIPNENVEKFKTALAKTDTKGRLNWVRYKVKSGDSLSEVAQNYNTSSKIIASVNNLDSSMIKIGQALLIPMAAKELDYYKFSESSRITRRQEKPAGRFKIVHKVQSGDNLWDISRAYKVNYKSLAKWNNIAPKDALKINQKLVVWQGKKQGSANGKGIMRNITYKVRQGDSLARIANKFNVRIKDLVRWNGLAHQKYIQPGQALRLYIDVTKVNT